MSESLTVSRDPFARALLDRRCEGPGECAWCGQSRSTLFTYTVTTDGGLCPLLGQPHGAGRLFCNLDCYRAFNS